MEQTELTRHLSLRCRGTTGRWWWHGAGMHKGPKISIARDWRRWHSDVLERWETILLHVQRQNWLEAKRQTRRLTTYVTDTLLPPEALRFVEDHVKPGDRITIDSDPDYLPLELAQIHGMPLNVCCQALHMKHQIGQTISRTAASDCKSVSSPSRHAQPRVLMTVVCDDSARVEHKTVLSSLKKIYGEGSVNVFWDADVTRERIREQLRDHLCCFYHFGHGGANSRHAWLELSDGKLRASQIDQDLAIYSNGRRGFAFINSCWSGAAPSRRVTDIANVLIKGGFQAVVGNVLPPPRDASTCVAVAESLFFEAASHCYDLVETLHAIQERSWKLFRREASAKTEDEQKTLAWACYRLYGSPEVPFLPTPVSTAEGTIVLHTSSGDIRFNSLKMVSPGPATAATLKELVSQYQYLHTRDEEIDARLMVQHLLEHLPRETTKLLLRDIFASHLPGVWDDLMDIEVQGLLQRADQNRECDSEDAISINHLLQALIRTLTEENSTTTQIEETQISPALSLSPETTRYMHTLFRLAAGSRLCMEHFIQTYEISTGWQENIPNAFDRTKNQWRCEVETILRLAGLFWRFTGKDKVSVIDLFQATFVQACSLSVRREWGAFNDFIPNPPLQDRVDEHAHRSLNMALSLLAGDRKRVGKQGNVAGRSSVDDASKRERPFWWYLLGILMRFDPDVPKRLRNMEMDPLRLWRLVERYVGNLQGQEIVPDLSIAGVPVGMSTRLLPRAAEVVWAAELSVASSWVAGEKRRVLLRVPWDPDDSKWTSKIMNGATCSWLMARAERSADSITRERVWLHFPAIELIDARITRLRQGFLSKRRRRLAEVRQAMMNEISRNTVLCLHGLRKWVDSPNKAAQKKIRKILVTITTQGIPTVALVSRRDSKENGDLIRLLLDNGFAERVCDLDPLPERHLQEYLLGWGKTFCCVRDESEYEKYKRAVDVIIEDVLRVEENERLSRSMRLLKDARAAVDVGTEWVQAAEMATHRR